MSIYPFTFGNLRSVRGCGTEGTATTISISKTVTVGDRQV